MARFSALIWLAAFAAPALAARGPVRDSATARPNMVVVAPNQDYANTVALEVERAAERFYRAFGLSLVELPPGPTIIIQVGESSARKDGEGTLTTQESGGARKIHLLWGEPPLNRDALARGVGRALALRHAIADGAPRTTEGALAWVLDGAAMFATAPETVETEGARAALLARLAPRLSLEGALGLLEGQALDTAARRGLAGALLADASAGPGARRRLLASLAAFAVDPAASLAEVTGRSDAAEWWSEWWRAQSVRLPPQRLGGKLTLLWILAREKNTDANVAGEQDLAPVASPWFEPWFVAPPSIEADALAAIRVAIARRRAEAMEWFRAVAGEEYASREEWLAEGLRRAASDSIASGSGPALQWFHGLRAPPRAPATRAPSRKTERRLNQD
ncbi:MAG: hypothetical protein IT578_08835 [Verrucomicrobiae bacterium]|nr:hypothetical protein [Verrucomicrobiae bacterium]